MILKILLITCVLVAGGSAMFKDRCGIPGVPVNGDYKETKDPDIIEYFCMKDHRLNGNEKRRCRADGTRDSAVPRCEPNLFYKMPDIQLQGGGLMNLVQWEKFHNKSETSAEIGREPIDILLPRPTTIGELRFAIRGIPNAADSVVIATIRNQTSDKGYNCTLKNDKNDNGLRVVHLECPAHTAELVSVFSSGSKLRIFKVGIYGNTSEPDKNCGKPDIPANGYATVKDGTVNYNCNKEFKLAGKDTLTCEGGQWSDRAPVCTFPSAVISYDSDSSVNERQPNQNIIWIVLISIAAVCLMIVGLFFLWNHCRTKQCVPQEKIHHQTALLKQIP